MPCMTFPCCPEESNSQNEVLTRLMQYCHAVMRRALGTWKCLRMMTTPGPFSLLGSTEAVQR